MAINGLIMGCCGGGAGLFQPHDFCLQKHYSQSVRIPIYIVIIATFVTIADLLLALVPDVHVLGLLVPLIVVNCTSQSGKAFASRYRPEIITDGLGMGLGYLVRFLSGVSGSFWAWVLFLGSGYGGSFCSLGNHATAARCFLNYGHYCVCAESGWAGSKPVGAEVGPGQN